MLSQDILTDEPQPYGESKLLASSVVNQTSYQFDETDTLYLYTLSSILAGDSAAFDQLNTNSEYHILKSNRAAMLIKLAIHVESFYIIQNLFPKLEEIDAYHAFILALKWEKTNSVAALSSNQEVLESIVCQAVLSGDDITFEAALEMHKASEFHFKNNLALEYAVSNQRTSMVEILLKRDGINPCADDNKIVKLAKQCAKLNSNKDSKAIAILMSQDERVLLSRAANYIQAKDMARFKKLMSRNYFLDKLCVIQDNLLMMCVSLKRKEAFSLLLDALYVKGSINSDRIFEYAQLNEAQWALDVLNKYPVIIQDKLISAIQSDNFVLFTQVLEQLHAIDNTKIIEDIVKAAIEETVKHNRLDMFKKLVECNAVTLSGDDQWLLRFVCAHKSQLILDYIITTQAHYHNEVRPVRHDSKGLALLAAIDSKNASIVSLALELDGLNLSPDYIQQIQNHCFDKCSYLIDRLNYHPTFTKSIYKPKFTPFKALEPLAEDKPANITVHFDRQKQLDKDWRDLQSVLEMSFDLFISPPKELPKAYHSKIY